MLTIYRYETNNGCDVCDAMEGLYDEEPARPHANCQCIISEVEDQESGTHLTLQASDWYRVGDGWSWKPDEDTAAYNSDEDGDNYGETWRKKGVLTVDCCDGRTSTGEEYDFGFSADLRGMSREEADAAIEEGMWESEQALRRRAEELIEQDCDPCDHVA